MENTSVPVETVRDIRDRCLCLATQRAARLLARRFDRAFAPLGITNGQFSLLVALSGEWKPRLGELAEFLAMDSTTLTAAAKVLERKGHLMLVPDEADGRVRRPTLTEAGRQVVAEAVLIWRDEHRKLEAGFDGLDPQALARGLGQLR